MHASLEQLVSRRDGEALAGEVAQHIEACAECTAELEGLRQLRRELQSLPELPAAPGNWRAVAAQAYPGKVRRLRAAWWLGGALAASALLVAVLVNRTSVPTTIADTRGPTVTVPRLSEAATSALMTRSRTLESVLRAMPQGPSVVRASTAGTIDELEESIARVDYRLYYGAERELTPVQAQRLWQERVDLMNSLVRVRYAQTRAEF